MTAWKLGLLLPCDHWGEAAVAVGSVHLLRALSQSEWTRSSEGPDPGVTAVWGTEMKGNVCD